MTWEVFEEMIECGFCSRMSMIGMVSTRKSFFYMFWMEWEGRLIRLHERALLSIFMIFKSVLGDRKA